MYRSILVPLDGSRFSEHALPLATNLARQTGAVLHLAQAHVAVVPLGLEIPLDHDDTAQRAGEQAYLEGVARQLVRQGLLNITTTVLDAPVADALGAYAAAHNIDLVVMTTHGRGALSRLWLGSVADRLTRLSPAPLLLVRPGETAPDLDRQPALAHILIPLDGSALAEQILPYAIALGTASAEYWLLQVAELALDGMGSDLYASPFDTSVVDRVRSYAQHYLDRVAAPLRAEGLKVQTAVVFGWSAQDILDYAHTHRADAIALATHGRSGVSRLLLGSYADKIVRGANVPVLILRPSSDLARSDK